MVSESNPARFHLFAVTAVSDAGAYHDYTVTYVAGSGSFENGRALWVGLARKGPIGDDGANVFLVGEEAVDDSSGTITYSGTAHPTFGSSILNVNFDQDVAGPIFVHVNACAYVDAFFNAGAVTGVALDGGTKKTLSRTGTSGLGDGRTVFVGGGAFFPAVAVGNHDVDLHLSRVTYDGILLAAAESPVRLTVLHS